VVAGGHEPRRPRPRPTACRLSDSGHTGSGPGGKYPRYDERIPLHRCHAGRQPVSERDYEKSLDDLPTELREAYRFGN